MRSNADESPFDRPIERRFTVQEAAKVLGITPEAVRGRIQRGTLPKEKASDGTVYVRLNADQMRSTEDEPPDASRSIGDQTPDESLLVEELRERVEHLTRIIETRDEEIKRRDAILLTLAQRVPELEPPSESPPEPRGSPEPASEKRGKGEVPPEPEKKQRSWLYRFFFGP